MNPKTVLLFAFAFAAAVSVKAADYSVTLSKVHLCCDTCVEDAEKAASQVSGASAEADKTGQSVKITASDVATAQKAVDAIVAAGYYGIPSDPAIHVTSSTVADQTVNGLKVSSVHLCCKKCVTSFNKTVAKVKGVTGSSAAKGADTFEITGTFNAKDVIDALHTAGFSAKVD